MLKRLVLWTVAIVAVIAVGTVLAFRLSPWPSVAIIAYLFSRGDAASEAALVRHVPPGIAARRDIAYDDGPDEVLDIYRPEAAAGPLPTIVWVHGGAWVAGSKDGVANYLKVLAGQGYTTVAIEYSRGYGATYPKPVTQVNSALAYIVENAEELGIEPSSLVLAGDSAGAQIAGQIALISTNADYARQVGITPALRKEQLAAMVLVSGAFDMEAVDLSGDHAWFLRTVLWAYSGTRQFLSDERFRLISVTRYVDSAFPPSFISSGNGDPLAPQAVALAEKLDGLGVAADALFFPADYDPPLPHEYQFNLDTPAGQEALARMLAFLVRVQVPHAGSAPAN
jgi:acetyl esterase/lipase